MEESNISPVPSSKASVPTYTFSDAIKEIMSGRKLSRLAWNTNDVYILLQNENLMIYIEGEFKNLIVSVHDMDATDWFCLPEPNILEDR